METERGEKEYIKKRSFFFRRPHDCETLSYKKLDNIRCLSLNLRSDKILSFLVCFTRIMVLSSVGVYLSLASLGSRWLCVIAKMPLFFLLFARSCDTRRGWDGYVLCSIFIIYLFFSVFKMAAHFCEWMWGTFRIRSCARYICPQTFRTLFSPGTYRASHNAPCEQDA